MVVVLTDQYKELRKQNGKYDGDGKQNANIYAIENMVLLAKEKITTTTETKAHSNTCIHIEMA